MVPKPSITFVRSDGQRLCVDGTVLAMESLAGVGAPNAEVFAEKRAVGDGDVITARRAASRELTVSIKSRYPAQNAALRKLIGSFFNIRYTFDALVCYEGVSRVARGCAVRAMKLDTQSVYRPLCLVLTLYCADAYLQSPDQFGRNIAAVHGAFSFPFHSVCEKGFAYSVFDFTRHVRLSNDGDAPTWCRAVITAKGSVQEPRIEKGSAFVRVLCTLSEGDVLEMDAESRTVRLNGLNAVHLIDRASDFSALELAVGENTLSYGAAEGDHLLEVTLYYAKRYQGL